MLELKKVLSPEFELNTVTNTILSGSEKVFQTATVRELLWDGVAAIDCRGTESPSEGKVICSLLKPHLPVMIAEHEPGLYKMAYLRHVSSTHMHLCSLRTQQQVRMQLTTIYAKLFRIASTETTWCLIFATK
jgi:hypothetical protein